VLPIEIQHLLSGENQARAKQDESATSNIGGSPESAKGQIVSSLLSLPDPQSSTMQETLRW
jgi:hypothetical protein